MVPDSASLPSRNEIVRRLTSELDYPISAAESIASQLNQSRPEVRAAFMDWWSDGSLDTVEIHGWTAHRIANRVGCRPPTAVLNLQWLLDDPIAAIAAFSRGVDRIVPKDPQT